ncbi:MAG: hypothetical protein KIT84_29070 [Labilithrix sp.]|nr:hypothetical protein [Labilithrix sp.]MCW5815113.1 hypothetical protein [Labilithrix sp.]
MNARLGSGLALAAAIAFASAFAATRRAHADDGAGDVAAANERCANRLAIAFVGKSAADAELTAADPKAALDGLLDSEDFRERFARFVNMKFNDAPGAKQLEDAPYWVARLVLAEDRPWSDMFLGKLRLVEIASQVAIREDAAGLGYFRGIDWYRRYEGNEENGIKLATAYRIMNNVVGLRLTATTAAPDADHGLAGRQAGGCKGCHFDGWFALDKVAAVLPKKGEAFDAYRGGPKEMLGGQQIANDVELVTALVASENFSVNACRLAFEFLNGREDNRCDGPVLDRCVDTFKAEKTITSALASIAREPGFCE